ncbi:hypothetical protein LSH36_748g01016 [Paralvinella palmiformis]|uniref:J domain-containing protein n=1 Tax=Paralvinella palmiformis TaxID=53620 RepID=A0AAD9J1Y7_9ANNE|nr:hypothetical protein LSH36_748g01016 [Paralvinella palmiformis]
MVLAYHSAVGVLSLFLLSVDTCAEGTVGPTGMRSSCLSALFIVAWSTLIKGLGASSSEVEQHLELGKKLLAAGQLADALSHYHAAVEGDPNNYMTYFRRATVYLALGKSKSALPDLDKVIELKPDFNSARLQRANVKLKQGQLDDAEEDYRAVLSREGANSEAHEKLNGLRPLREGIRNAQYQINRRDYQGAINTLGPIIEMCPWDPALRELRAECYEAQGDLFKAINDIRPTTKLRNDNTAAYFKISKMLYEMGDADESLTEIRECLKLDPDHKDCFSHYKKVKKLAKQISSVHELINEQKWDDCISKVDQMLKTEPELFAFVHKANSHKCHCYAKNQKASEAFAACNRVLDVDSENVEAMCDRAEAYLTNEQYDEAIQDYKSALDIDNNYRRAKDGLQRAEKLLKQSKKRDYYKILGVKRNARKKDIIKAYRKMAAQWHPDRYKGDEKAMAEKKFIDIAAAKEVLTDPEKREKFDNGEDPLDPEDQSGGGGPFWHQGFNPFGQGGFQFKFHFN